MPRVPEWAHRRQDLTHDEPQLLPWQRLGFSLPALIQLSQEKVSTLDVERPGLPQGLEDSQCVLGVMPVFVQIRDHSFLLEDMPFAISDVHIDISKMLPEAGAVHGIALGRCL